MTKARDLANAADALDDVSATELGYVNGVTSAIQTQLNNKQAVVSGVDDTEIGYLNGVTSAIQTQLDGKIAKSLVDAAGDLIYGSANDTVTRLGIGTAGQYLKVNSGATAPEWATLSAGGMTLIQEIVPNNTASSYSFSSIPGTYKQLLLIWTGTTTGNATTGFVMRINNDSGANYILNGSADFTTPQNASNTSIQLGGFTPFYQTDNYGSESSKGELFIDNYASTTKLKYLNVRYGYRTAGASQIAVDATGYWNSTSAITSIDITRSTGAGNLDNTTNGSIRLYGIS